MLAIAAAKIFRAPVVACDIDTLAVEAARANARLNRVGPFVTLVRATGVNAPAIRQRKPYDLIFANILLGPLMRLAVPLARLAAPGARWCCPAYCRRTPMPYSRSAARKASCSSGAYCSKVG